MRVYPAKAVMRARELHGAGWSISKITVLLEREFGRRPGRPTVRSWVDQEWAEHARRRRLADPDKRLRWTPSPRTNASPQWKLARMRELRERGLSYLAIAAVAEVWWGEATTGPTVRYRLERERKAA